MSSEVIQLSKFSSRPFQYKSGDSFRLGLSFNYDVTNVGFEMKIFEDGNPTALKTFPDADWTLNNSRKKTLVKAPADMNLPAGTYRLKITHTFPDNTVRTRFDSVLTILP